MGGGSLSRSGVIAGMYEAIYVWDRYDENGVVRYTCLKNIKNDLYAVHSADFFYIDSVEKYQMEHFRNFLEIFTEQDPANRCDWFEKLQDAIENHIVEFEGINSSA